MIFKKTAPIDFVRKLLHYHPETGDFVWKQRDASMFCEGKISAEVKAKRFNTRYAGKSAETDHSNGYKNISIPGKGSMRAHRVAWAIVYGVWPSDDVDHINGDRTDNRICNLRLSTRSENLRNKKKFPRNTSGYVGVSFFKERNNWNAKIGVNGKYINLGYFKTKEDAAKARAKAELKYWGEYAITRAMGLEVREV